MLTTAQAAEQLGCDASTVRRWCIRETAAGRPLGTKAGRDWLLSAADVKRLRKLVQSGPGRPNLQQESR